MYPRLNSSPSSQGYKQLSTEALTQSVLNPELSSHGMHGDGAPVLSRANTIQPGKSYGDLKSLAGRSRGKKTRAIKWLVLLSSGERQVFTLDKRQLIQTCRLEIPIRDMRLMDSALGNETLAQLLVRDNALVFSMEHVRLIIMHDKVVVPLDDGGSGQAPPTAVTQDRPTGLSSDLKDRFIAHLECVVMDWALQHSTGLPTPTAAGNAGGNHGNGPALPGAQPPVSAAAVAAHGASTGVCSHTAGPTIAAQLEAHIAANSSRAGAALPVRSGSGTGGGGGGGTTGAGSPALGGGGGGGFGMGSETASQNAFDPEYQPFEMLVLETALSEICTHLHREVDTLQLNCQPALEALMKTADTANLEAVRRVKTQHSRLVTRVTATREALERLMEDDDDMVRMCLTQQAHMRLAAVAAAAAAAAQQQHHHHHHSHHTSNASLTGIGIGTSTGTGTGQGSTPTPGAGATPGAPAPSPAQATPAGPSGGGGCHSPESSSSPSQKDAHQLALLMSSSLSASYMLPASLAARAVRHQVGKKAGGTLGEALAEAAAVAAAAAAAPGGPGSGGGVGGGGGEVMEHDFLDVEALLESYAIIVDTTYQTLMSIGEYIDDTEDLINIQLDYSRNKLIRFDILLTTGTFALAFFNIVTGMLGENLVLPEGITQDLSGFILVNGGTLVFCVTTFLTLFTVFKWQKVL